MNADKLFEDALLAQQKGDLEAALDLFAATILAKPDHPAAWHCRGLIEDRLDRPFNALIHLNQSIALSSHQAVWCNRGVIAGKLDLLEEAVASFKKALEFGDAYEPHINLGDFYIRQMDLEKAEQEYRAAIKCKPKDPGAHGNLGKVLIARGKWAEGHREMYWRHKEMPTMERGRYPMWTGQELGNKSIIIYPEGGLGDEILDMRYVIDLKARFPNTRVILEARPQMYRLAKHSLQGRIDDVIPQWDPPPVTPDYCVAISDIPQYTGITQDTIPYKKGYLAPPYGPPFDLPKGLKVGLCWLTGRRPLMKWTDRMMKAKSIPLAEFSTLFEYTDVSFVCLQLDRADPTVMRRLGMVDPMKQVRDLADTARLLQSLDLVISVDTSIAHLAGALGYPVWNLMRFDEITTYPGGNQFYHSMKFYRQTEPNDWRPILRNLINDFDTWVTAKAVPQLQVSGVASPGSEEVREAAE